MLRFDLLFCCSQIWLTIKLKLFTLILFTSKKEYDYFNTLLFTLFFFLLTKNANHTLHNNLFDFFFKIGLVNTKLKGYAHKCRVKVTVSGSKMRLIKWMRGGGKAKMKKFKEMYEGWGWGCDYSFKFNITRFICLNTSM